MTLNTSVNRARLIVLACAGLVLTAAGTGSSQTSERFHARLSVVPVDAATSRRTAGTGTIHATLTGAELVLSGRFEGMKSAATQAHLHRAPKGRRGPPVATFAVPKAASGVVDARVTLTEELVRALRAGELFVQIHTEGNPEGEIRGWLFPEER